MLEEPNYDIVRTIGSGAFGFVFEAVNRKTGLHVALKRIEKVGKGMSRENEMLYMLKGCPNIIQIQDLFYSQTEKGKLVQNIVFEYLDDNLENIIRKTQKKQTYLSSDTIKSYMYQILIGVREMHERKIAHRDLKPENILVNCKGEIKICDFGCSKIIDPKGKNTPYVMSQYYRAPELIMAITKYSVSVDMWSVGCILAELALLRPFFVGANEGDQLFAILKIMGSFTEEEQKALKQRVPFDVHLFQSLKGFKRVDFNSLFSHMKQKKEFIDLLTKMLAYLPEKRITPSEALSHPFFKNMKQIQILDECQAQD